jgi:hypothetical protein
MSVSLSLSHTQSDERDRRRTAHTLLRRAKARQPDLQVLAFSVPNDATCDKKAETYSSPLLIEAGWRAL